MDPGDKFASDRQNFWFFPRVSWHLKISRSSDFVGIVKNGQSFCHFSASYLFNHATMAHPWLFISPIRRSERVPWTLQRVRDPPPARTSPVRI
jgi:hypothetical protein